MDALLRNELSARQFDRPLKDTTIDTMVPLPSGAGSADPFREQDGGAMKDRFKDALN